MRHFSLLTLVCVFLAFGQSLASAQVVQYPNGKRVKILSSRAGANQLAGTQQRYIINHDREVYIDPKKRELDEEQARARLAYPNEEEPEETAEDPPIRESIK